MKFIDLCCGIGGFHQALTNLGMECVLASDIDKECRKVYKENYNLEPKGDLRNIKIEEIPKFDILCAGFPCVSFSKAGNQKGFNDDRGNLFFSICKIIDYHKPKFLLMENVRNLKTHDKGNTWDVIKNKIENLGYYLKPLILNVLQFGVPQSRERIIILCKRKDLGIIPEFHDLPNLNTHLDSIMEPKTHEKYNLTGKMKITEKVWNDFLVLLNSNNISVPKFPIWTDWWDSDGENTTVTKYDKKKSEEENKILIEKRQKDFYKKYKNWIDKNREFYNSNYELLQPWLIESRKNDLWLGSVRKFEWQTGENKLTMNQVLWSARGSGVRVKKLDYSPTLVAMASMVPVYGPKSRYITPRECARLQSFPEDFIIHEKDKIAYKQFGNAVNVNMIQYCAEFLINIKKNFN